MYKDKQQISDTYFRGIFKCPFHSSSMYNIFIMQFYGKEQICMQKCDTFVSFRVLEHVTISEN